METNKGLVLVNGMLLIGKELTAARKVCYTVDTREIVIDEDEFLFLIRRRIAVAAAVFATATPEKIRTAYVNLRALTDLFDTVTSYDGQFDHDVRSVLAHSGSQRRYFVLTSHA